MEEQSLYDDFFKKFQKELLAIANSDYGRALFRIPEKEKVVKLSPNSYHIELDKGIYRAVIRCYELYARLITTGIGVKGLKPIPSAMRFIGRKSDIAFPEFYVPLMSQDSWFSGAGDGSMYYNPGAAGDCTIWNTAMDFTGSAGWVDYTSNNTFAMITQNGGGSCICARGFWPFNTASLDQAIGLDSGNFKLWGYANYQDTDGKAVCVVEGQQVSPSSLAGSDYSKLVRNVLLSDTQILLHLSNVAYNDWPLNAAGLDNINKIGWTKFATIGNVDYGDSCTTGPVCGHSVRTSEYTGTSSDPILILNYNNYQGGMN